MQSYLHSLKSKACRKEGVSNYLEKGSFPLPPPPNLYCQEECQVNKDDNIHKSEALKR